MRLLLRIFGPPHELLHVTALLLIGRRPHRVTRAHVDLRDSLSDAQDLFVAGLPALIFGALALVGVLGLLNAHTVAQALLALLVVTIGRFGTASAAGDLQLIAWRFEHQ